MASRKTYNTEDHFHCFICLEHLKGRHPRLLNCHHSLCEPCLKKLVKKEQISCPKCREYTKVKGGDVTILPINFHIIPFLDETRKSELERMCQICNDSIAVYKCKECSHMLCPSCAESHGQLKRYKQHTVFTLCVKHYDVINQICTQCCEPVCAKCLILVHRKHEDKVVACEDGMGHLHEAIDDMIKSTNKDINSIRNIIQEDEPKILKVESYLTKYRNQQLDIASEDKKLFEEMQTYVKQNTGVRNEQKEALRKTEVIFNDLSNLQRQSDDEILVGYVGMMKMKGSFSKTKPNNLKRLPPLPSKATKLLAEDLLLTKPYLVANVTSSRKLTIKHAVMGATMWDDSVIFADFEGKHVTRVNTVGEVEDVYPIDLEDGPPVAVTIHGRSLGIAQTKVLTQIIDVNNPNGKIKQYKPDIESIGEICIVSDTKVICADMVQGEIYQYDPDEDETKVVLQVKSPLYVNLMMADDSVKYVITLGEDHCLKVYSSRWKFEFTIGKGKGSGDGYMCLPCDCCFTDEGILVADSLNHRICHFDYAGEFVKHLLTDRDGLENPRGLVYRHPLLWVICKKNIMCFKVYAQ